MKKKLINQEFVMSFKKCLITPSSSKLNQIFGQVVMEYFILFAIVSMIIVIGMTTFFPRMQVSFEAIQQASINAIVNSN